MLIDAVLTQNNTEIVYAKILIRLIREDFANKKIMLFDFLFLRQNKPNCWFKIQTINMENEPTFKVNDWLVCLNGSLLWMRA